MEHYFMKSKSIANFASVAALVALLPLEISSARAISAPAVMVASDTVVQPSQFQRVEWNEDRKSKLRRAFWLVEHAKGDYAGHRAKAMAHIKHAGEVLSIDLHGKGYGEGMGQAESDARLREARDLLKDVERESSGKEQEIITNGVRELNKALRDA
jgi:hypothetical protein